MRSDLDLHQTHDGEGDHVAQYIRVSGLLHKRTQVHHLVSHRWSLRFQVGLRNPTPTRVLPVTAASPLARCGAIKERAREWPCYRPATPPLGTRPPNGQPTE